MFSVLLVDLEGDLGDARDAVLGEFQDVNLFGAEQRGVLPSGQRRLRVR